jgi:HSP20 family protein
MVATHVTRDPFLTDLRLVDDVFERFFGTGNGRVTGFVPTIDVRETADDYLVLVDLPGVKSEDVSIEVDERVLSISGVRTPVETGEARLGERPYGSFVRNLTLPQGVDADTITADYHDGVLELRVPKPAEQKPKRIALNGGKKALNR